MARAAALSYQIVKLDYVIYYVLLLRTLAVSSGGNTYIQFFIFDN